MLIGFTGRGGVTEHMTENNKVEELTKAERPRDFEEQKAPLRDETTLPDIPNAPEPILPKKESRAEENKSEAEWDTGLNEPVPQGEEESNIGLL